MKHFMIGPDVDEPVIPGQPLLYVYMHDSSVYIHLTEEPMAFQKSSLASHYIAPSSLQPCKYLLSSLPIIHVGL